VTVTPFRSKAQLANFPWIGVDAPVAIVAVRDPDVDCRRQEINLRRRFGLTAAEARLTMEILKRGRPSRCREAERHLRYDGQLSPCAHL
jgi:hypothetical protein